MIKRERMEGMERKKVARLMFIDWSHRNSHSYLIHVLSHQRTLFLYIKKHSLTRPLSLIFLFLQVRWWNVGCSLVG